VTYPFADYLVLLHGVASTLQPELIGTFGSAIVRSQSPGNLPPFRVFQFTIDQQLV
jgi:hypothetical protein